METRDVEEIRAAVRDRYGRAATAADSSCGPTAGPAAGADGDQVASFD